MKISTRIITSSIVFMCTLLALFCIAYLNSENSISNMRKIEYQKIPLLQSIDEISLILLTHRRYEKDILLNIGDIERQKRYLASFENQNKLIYKELAFVETIIKQDPATYSVLSSDISSIYKNLEEYIAGVKSVANYVMANPHITPQAGNEMIDDFKDATYDTESDVNNLVKKSIEIVTGLLENERENLSIYQLITFAVMLIGSTLVSVVMFITFRSITYPLNSVITYAKELEEGHYDAELKGEFAAEMGSLSSVLSSMAENLKREIENARTETEHANKALQEAERASQAVESAREEAISKTEGILKAANELEAIVSAIASASEQLSAQIELSSQGANEQAGRITETASAMSEMNSTVLEVARNSSSSAEIADNTKKMALEGSEITNKCKVAINTVRDESLSLRDNMSALAENAQSINTVMGVISDIADQTNLLALNAAIEAARAGEAGRGFAVVADEVRKLAEKTMSSTVEVSTAINSIQQSTETNVKQVDVAVRDIEIATELANQSGETLQLILQMAEESADGIRTIATASEEQSSTSDAISASIETVNVLASDNSAAMREAGQAVSDLARQSHHLTRLVEALKNS